MTIKDTLVIGLEGPHATGKSTLAYALAGLSNSNNIRAGCIGELIRKSPFFLDSAQHPVDSWAELHALSAQVAEELLAARDLDLLVCDRTVLSPLAYWNVRDPARTAREVALYEGVHAFVRSYLPVYDAVIYMSDRHEVSAGLDPFRDADLERLPLTEVAFWESIDESMRALITQFGLPVREVPKGLTVAATLSWAVEMLPAILVPVESTKPRFD